VPEAWLLVQLQKLENMPAVKTHTLGPRATAHLLEASSQAALPTTEDVLGCTVQATDSAEISSEGRPACCWAKVTRTSSLSIAAALASGASGAFLLQMLLSFALAM
jgi:hypothetical protein